MHAAVGGILSNGVISGAFGTNVGVRFRAISGHALRCSCRSNSGFIFVSVAACSRVVIPGALLNSGTGFLLRNASYLISFRSNAPLDISLPNSIILAVARARPNLRNGHSGTNAGPTAIRAKTRVRIPLFVGRNSHIGVGARSNSCANHRGG